MPSSGPCSGESEGMNVTGARASAVPWPGIGHESSSPRLLRGRSVVHAPELERATPPALELDDHVQLLPVLGAEIVLGDLPATRDLALDHEIVALPAALDLDVPASLHHLGDLPAVTVQYQGRAPVRPKRDARIGLPDRECGGRIEHQLRRLAHPLALLVAHPSAAAPLTAAAPPAEAPASGRCGAPSTGCSRDRPRSS